MIMQRIKLSSLTMALLGLSLLTPSFLTLCGACTPKDIFLSISLCYLAILMVAAFFCCLISGKALNIVTICGGMLWLFNGGGLAIAHLLSTAPRETLVFDRYILSYLPLPMDAVLAAVQISLSSVCFFFSGAFALMPSREGGQSASRCPLIPSSNQQPSGLTEATHTRWVAYCLLSLSFIPHFLMLARSREVAASAGYMGLFTDGGYVRGTYGALASAFVPGCFYLFGSSAPRSYGRFVAIALLSAGVGPYLFCGDRGLLFSTIVAITWYFHAHVKPLRAQQLVPIAIALLIVSRLIFTARLGNATMLTVTDLAPDQLSPLASVIDAVAELGGSLATVAYTIDLVPTTRPFECGMTYLYSFASLFPSLIFPNGNHPTWSRGEEAAWLISIVSPRTAEFGGGLGFSLIAEAYLNFGTLFGATFFFLIGVFTAVVNRYAASPGFPNRGAAGAVFLTISMLAARGESLMVFRRLLLLVGIPIAVASIMGFRIAGSRVSPFFLPNGQRHDTRTAYR